MKIRICFLGMFMVMLVACALVPALLAQDEELQKANSIGDAKQKAAALLQYVKAHPDASTTESVMSDVENLLNEMYQDKNYAGLGALAETYLGIKQDDEVVLNVALGTFYATNEFAKAAKYGEMYYAKKPSPEVAKLVAYCYGKVGNDTKRLQFMEASGTKASGSDYSRLVTQYASRRDVTSAAATCQKWIAAEEASMPAAEKGRCLAIIGQSEYEKKQYRQAITTLNSAAKASPKNDAPYYFLGMTYWQLQDAQTAMKQFAKAAILGQGWAKASREKLEYLYKSTHNGSLDGMDYILRAAAAELK